MSKPYIVIGNWKSNPQMLEEARSIASAARASARSLSRTEVVACPPFPFISAAVPKQPVEGYAVGAQSVSVHAGGAHTGDVSAEMLSSIGVSYAIVGHSEQRAAGDTDQMVAERAGRAIDAGLRAVVCIGEASRDDEGSHLEFLKGQLAAALGGIAAGRAAKAMIAYEPIWAIGAKAAMAPDDIYETSLFIRKTFADMFGADAGRAVRVLYGGSVNAANAAEIIRVGKVDGLLVGRASVDAAEFDALLSAVDAVR